MSFFPVSQFLQNVVFSSFLVLLSPLIYTDFEFTKNTKAGASKREKYDFTQSSLIFQQNSVCQNVINNYRSNTHRPPATFDSTRIYGRDRAFLLKYLLIFLFITKLKRFDNIFKLFHDLSSNLNTHLSIHTLYK